MELPLGDLKNVLCLKFVEEFQVRVGVCKLMVKDCWQDDRVARKFNGRVPEEYAEGPGFESGSGHKFSPVIFMTLNLV